MKTTNSRNKHTWGDSSSKLKTTLICSMAAVMFASLLDARAGAGDNLPPVAANDSLQRNQDSRLRVRAATLLANDTDPDGDSLTLNSVSATSAAGGTVVMRGKWISYNPPAGITNSDSFTYVIADSRGLLATGTVSITIRADLDPSQNVAAREVLPNGDCRVQFAGIPGLLYTIQYADSLETPHWRRLGKRLADATGQFEWIEPSAQGAGGRIYRSTHP